MSLVTEHYDAYPYPERDPADEKRRLITGSPSLPTEIDHFIYGGQRDWSVPLRILVAGGGSGDGLVQLAQLLTTAARPYEITYVDLSTSARAIAEKRVEIRGLENIKFVTGSLIDAASLGEFDYIDCCGVLHHLTNPIEGFSALRRVVAPNGGMGFMVYAPYGRSGVYPLQEAFGVILDGLKPKARLTMAREIYESVPAGHPFKRNQQVQDHQTGDAGFYDLLLHDQDRAYTVTDLCKTLSEANWSAPSFCQPGLYDLSRITELKSELNPVAAMAVAEKLRGTLKVHVGYVVPGEGRRTIPDGRSLTDVPHLMTENPADLANAIRSGKSFNINCSGVTSKVDLPSQAADIVTHINGRWNVGELRKRSGINAVLFKSLWKQIDGAFRPWGLLHYSRLNR